MYLYFSKLEEKCRELLRESGRDENDVMRSLNDEDSFVSAIT